MIAHTVDILALIIAYGGPILLVWRWHFRGAVAGAIVNWLIMSTIGPILSWLDPTRDNAMLDAVTVYLAPIFAIAYCGAILSCGYVFAWIARRRSTLGVPRS